MDSNNLLTKLKSFAQDAKTISKKNINIGATFSMLTDEEISLVLAHRAKKLRLENNIKQNEFSKSANLSSATTYSNFEQTGKASLINFIKIVRNFGRIKELESLLKSDISSVIENAQNPKKNKKRVR
ncbi:MAG: hypothetical protein Q9M32_06250 [Sulfurimonas sp.]|nr:hypothetical protein [Sulfurimonas sp.]MDQ7062413.1 hypothetical protein [Sulfurimonas sp.]